MPPVFWDYAPVAPTIIALLISVIAVWVTHLKNKGLKIGLLLMAIVAGLGGAWATIAGQHHIIEAAARERESAQRERQNTEQRLTTLGQLIAEGDGLQATVAGNKDAPVDKDGVNAWIIKTEEFLALEPGGFLSRYRDYAGLAPPSVPPSLGSESVTGERVQYWAVMAYRLARLQQFSEELSARVR
jgi:hypothetical protein